jgi:hypothetical protein
MMALEVVCMEELLSRGRVLIDGNSTTINLEVIPLRIVAEHFGVKLRTVNDKRWRRRARLRVTRLGGKVLGVTPDDLRRALASDF